MYARTVDQQVLTLAVSGLLWERSLVMVDQETNSYWSHLLGTAMEGPLQGAQLRVIPSTLTDWATWRAKHAQTTVVALERTSGTYTRRIHQRDPHLLIGLADPSESRFWYFAALRQQPVINDTFLGQPIVVCYDPPSGTAVVFSRSVMQRVLTFALRDDQLIDQQTGTSWDRVTGVAVRGRLQGSRLTTQPAVVSLDRAWAAFHPHAKPGNHGLPQEPSLKE